MDSLECTRGCWWTSSRAMQIRRAGVSPRPGRDDVVKGTECKSCLEVALLVTLDKVPGQESRGIRSKISPIQLVVVQETVSWVTQVFIGEVVRIGVLAAAKALVHFA